jgi:hypothetical protein
VAYPRPKRSATLTEGAHGGTLGSPVCYGT